MTRDEARATWKEIGLAASEGAEDEKLEDQFKRDGFFRRTEIAYVFNVLDELNLKIVEK